MSPESIGPGTAAIVVALGGAAGACIRATVYITIARMHESKTWTAFPRGTMLVNAVGSIVLGALVGLSLDAEPGTGEAALHESTRLFLATGICGSLTTFSTFIADLEILREARAPARLALHVLANVGLSVAGAFGALAFFGG